MLWIMKDIMTSQDRLAVRINQIMISFTIVRGSSCNLHDPSGKFWNRLSINIISLSDMIYQFHHQQQQRMLLDKLKISCQLQEIRVHPFISQSLLVNKLKGFTQQFFLSLSELLLLLLLLHLLVYPVNCTIKNPHNAA